jgi:ubiquitin-protein ligase
MATRLSKRMFNDIRAAQEPELRNQGIYYWFDEADITHGFALIRGHSMTPYEGLLGLFEFKFAEEYPFSPPQVIWRTHDGVTRFHPQFYKGGKVCLSILGTWNGPGWSSSINLVSILQILQSLLVENPLACEPGYERGTLEDPNFLAYKEYLEYRIARYMIQQLLLWKRTPEHSLWYPFQEEVTELYPSLVSFWTRQIRQKSQESEKVFSEKYFTTAGQTDWKGLCDLLPKLE